MQMRKSMKQLWKRSFLYAIYHEQRTFWYVLIVSYFSENLKL